MIPEVDDEMLVKVGTMNIISCFQQQAEDYEERLSEQLDVFKEQKQTLSEKGSETEMKSMNRTRFTKCIMGEYGTKKRALERNENLDEYMGFRPSKRKKLNR